MKENMQLSSYPGGPANHNDQPVQQGIVNPAYSPTGDQPYPITDAELYPQTIIQPYTTDSPRPAPFRAIADINMLQGIPPMDKAVRCEFFRKAYGILMCQLFVTGNIIAAFLFIHEFKMYVIFNKWVYWTSCGLMFVCVISTIFGSSIRRKAPWNFLFLGIFTLCEGLMMGVISSFYNVDAVLIGVGITCAVTFTLMLFTFQTKVDILSMGSVLCTFLSVLIFAGICMTFMPQTMWTMILYGSAGAFIFSMFTLCDTWIMMNGKHPYSPSPEEFVFASLNYYVDIIYLFILCSLSVILP